MSEQHSIEGKPISGPDTLHLTILKVAGGDAAFAAALRSMMWQQYQNAGCPYGPSEQDLFNWWKEELSAEAVEHRARKRTERRPRRRSMRG